MSLYYSTKHGLKIARWQARRAATPIAPNSAFSLWTDQFNNLLDVLKSSPLAEFWRLVGVQ